MGKFGPQPIHDASEGQPKAIYQYAGEERINRRPSGRVERFVDPVGNVCNIQLAPAGDPNPVATVDRKRMELRRDGWVEHAKCPLKHGVRLSTPAIEKDFFEMPSALDRPCEEDPRVMRAEMKGRTKVLYAQEACKHVEWLIADRRKREEIENNKRFANRALEEKRALEKRELEQLQLEEAKERSQARKGKTRKPTEATE